MAAVACLTPYSRTALSRNTDELMRRNLDALREEDKWTHDLVFCDPYILPFLGLSDSYSERDLESAPAREMERFLLELDESFVFIARPKRLTVDGEDFYMES